MVTRAIRRYVLIQDRPAYEELLQHLDTHQDVWKVPQGEVAAWWERRQTASLDLSIVQGGTLRISCPLGDSVVEIDGHDLRIPPFECSVSLDMPRGAVSVTYGYTGIHSDFVNEMLGHLGYGHLTPAPPGQHADIAEEHWTTVLETLRCSAVDNKRYEREGIDALRSLISEAHHRRGIPDLRLWSLPHRSGRPYRAAVSTRYDVDKAIVNLPAIHELEAKYGLRSTAYLRPMGLFYGPSEIRRYRKVSGENEAALHGEFVSTAERRFGDELTAARKEKEFLEEVICAEVRGVCMHGGELRTNTTSRTQSAIEAAGFKYETMYRNDYYFPLHLPTDQGVRKTLSIGQHFADVTVEPGPAFPMILARTFIDRFSQAAAEGGIFVPVMHPLYFGLARYLRHPINLLRLAAFVPKFVVTASRTKRGEQYSNRPE